MSNEARVSLLKHQVNYAAANIVKSANSEDELIETVSQHLMHHQEMYRMLEFISDNPSETNVVAIRRLLAKVRGES